MPDSTWKEYYEKVGNEPNALTVQAAARTHKLGDALDLGSGNGRDSLYLRQQGFDLVVAVDSSPDTSDWIGEGIFHKKQTIESFIFDQHEVRLAERFELIVCVNTLFFFDKEMVLRLIDRMHWALQPLGFMAFNVLGEEDEWVKAGKQVSFFTDHDADELRRRHDCASYTYRNFDGKLANGKPKRWETHEFMYRKY